MVDNSQSPSRYNKVAEGVVTLAIFLVMAQTFLDDFAVIMNWNKTVQNILLFTGFFFDLFFTVEFLVRLYNAIFIEKKGWQYMVQGRGWIDFLASVPLLMLSSGPPILALLLSKAGFMQVGNILNLLKIIKAIRIARILRLLRVLKIFKNIKYADSSMAQRHVTKLTTISILLIVISLFCYEPLMKWLPNLHTDTAHNTQHANLISFLNTKGTFDASVMQSIDGLGDEILLIRKDNRLLYSRYDKPFYEKELNVHDYFLFTSTGQQGVWEVFIDIRNTNKSDEILSAGRNLFFFALIITLVFVYLVIYSPHFAMTISDPINIMIRGFEKHDYNLSVKVPEQYKEDEVFQLANLYNDVYLPLKDRLKDAENSSPDSSPLKLQMDDIKDIFK